MGPMGVARAVKSQFIRSSDDVRHLPLRGGTVTQVRISATYVDLILELESGGSAQIRLESRATVSADRDSLTLDAGPALGVAVAQLMDRRVAKIDVDGMDLVLVFEGDHTLTAHVEKSGYESYQVTWSGETWTAIQDFEA